MKSLYKILAIVAVVILAVVLLGGLVWTIIVCNKAGAWPVYICLAALVVFGWDNILGTFKWLLQKAFEK